jgi:hypothetical protein
VEGLAVSHDEPVIAPDQLKPMVSRRKATAGAILVALILVAMALVGNHQGRVENIFLFAIAGILVLIPIADFILRRNGLR